MIKVCDGLCASRERGGGGGGGMCIGSQHSEHLYVEQLALQYLVAGKSLV